MSMSVPVTTSLIPSVLQSAQDSSQSATDMRMPDIVLRTETPTSRSQVPDVPPSSSPPMSSDQSSSTAQLDSSSTLTPVSATTQPRSTAMCKHLHNDFFYR